MIRRVLLLMFLASFPATALLAQERGKLEVVEHPLIAVLQQFRAGKLEVSRNTSSGDRNPAHRSVIRGFRVQIFMGANRTEAYAAQARFQRLFEDFDTYVTYEEPNYRVKVGDFRSRAEAEQLMRSLRQQFTNVFVHTEDIFVYH